MRPDNLQGARQVPRYSKEELKRIRLKNLSQRMRTAKADCERIATSLLYEDLNETSQTVKVAVMNLKMALAALEMEI